MGTVGTVVETGWFVWVLWKEIDVGRTNIGIKQMSIFSCNHFPHCIDMGQILQRNQ